MILIIVIRINIRVSESDREEAMNLFRGKLIILNLLLFAAASANANEVITVVGQKSLPLSENRVPAERIHRDDIEVIGGRDLADILATVPGVELIPGLRGYGVMLQGLDSRYVLVLINGQRANGHIDGSIDLSRFKAQQIERIEIIRGPSSAIHGSDAMGGVINVVTRRQTTHNSEADIRIGSFRHQALNIGTQHLTADSQYRLDAGYSRRDAYSLTHHPLRTDGPKLKESFVSIGSEHTFNSKWELHSSFDYQKQDIARIDARETGAIFDQINKVNIFNAILKPVWRPSPERSIEWTAHFADYHDTYKSDQRFATALDSSENSRDRLFDFAINWYESKGAHDLAAGVDFASMELTSDRLIQDKVDRQRTGLYLQNQWQLHSDLVLVPGLRYDKDSQFGENVSKKLAVRWQASSAIELHLAYGEGFRAPDFKELYLAFLNSGVGYRVEGNERLKPEKSQNYTAQLIWTANQFWRMQTTVYHNTFDNLIAVAMTESGTMDRPTVYSYTNVNKARIQGIESSFEQRWNSWLQTSFSHHYLYARDKSHGRWLENRPLHSGKVQANFYLLDPEFTLSLSAYASGRRAFYDSDRLHWLGPVSTLQAHASYTFSKSITFYGAVKNLSNEGDPRFYPIEPRVWYAGIKTIF